VKIRIGFVSNSSTSSFLLFGINVDPEYKIDKCLLDKICNLFKRDFVGVERAFPVSDDNLKLMENYHLMKDCEISQAIERINESKESRAAFLFDLFGIVTCLYEEICGEYSFEEVMSLGFDGRNKIPLSLDKDYMEYATVSKNRLKELFGSYIIPEDIECSPFCEDVRELHRWYTSDN
jgi:hypothetical protein